MAGGASFQFIDIYDEIKWNCPFCGRKSKPVNITKKGNILAYCCLNIRMIPFISFRLDNQFPKSKYKTSTLQSIITKQGIDVANDVTNPIVPYMPINIVMPRHAGKSIRLYRD